MNRIFNILQISAYLILISGTVAHAAKAPPKGASKLPTESIFATTSSTGVVICGQTKGWEPGKMIGKGSEFFMPLRIEIKNYKKKTKVLSNDKKLKKLKKKLKDNKEVCKAGPLENNPTPPSEATPETTPAPAPNTTFNAYESPLTEEDINHLYRKAGLGLPTDQAKSFINQSSSQLVNYFMQYIDEPEVEEDAVSWLDENPVAPHYPNSSITANGINLYALRLLTKTQNQFHERFALLSLHDRLATSVNAVNTDGSMRYLMLNHLRLLRTVGAREMNYRKLIEEIGEDAVMVRWLTLDKNVKTAPNEDYARELMELFSLDTVNDAAQDNYTNLDIIQVARAFTGWNVLKFGTEWRVIFTPNTFDAAEDKVIFEGTPYAGVVKTGRDVVNHIFNAHPNASVSLAKFLAREYLREDVSPEIISSLAVLIKENNYNLAPVMAKLLSSAEFFKTENRFSIAKTPVERFVHLMRIMDKALMPYDFKNVREKLLDMGCILTQTESVFGCDKLEELPDGQRLLYSANLITTLSNNNTIFTNNNWTYAKLFPEGVTAPTPDQMIDHMQEIFGFNITILARAALRDYLNSAMNNQGSLIAENWNPTNAAMVRRKVAGLYRIFAAMPQIHDLR